MLNFAVPVTDDAADILFKLYSGDSEIPSANNAGYAYIASHTEDLESGALFRAWVVFLHFENVTHSDLLYFGHGASPFYTLL